MLLDSASVKIDGDLPKPSTARSLGIGVDDLLTGRGAGTSSSHSSRVPDFLVLFASQLVNAQAPAPKQSS